MDVDINRDIKDDPPVDSMAVASINDNDTCWIERMQVNNEPLNYDFLNAEDVECDGNEAQMEVPLDDDLCTTQIMVRSAVADL